MTSQLLPGEVPIDERTWTIYVCERGCKRVYLGPTTRGLICSHPDCGAYQLVSVEVVELSRLRAAEEERDALQEIACRFSDAVLGQQYVGSNGLDDVFAAHGRIVKKYPDEMERAYTARRTADG